MLPALPRYSGQPTPVDYERGFVEEVQVIRRLPPNPRMLLFLLICWVAIAIKHVAVIYACLHWPVPFHQLWINAPTFALGLLATVVYWRRT
jgi:hypothetical protein